jgi:hypothetical protein
MKKRGAYAQWLATHQPFHWFVEFYGIMQRGGFDVIIGNPPYVEYSKVRKEYTVKGYTTESCNNLFALTTERSIALLSKQGRCGLIIPVSFSSSGALNPLRDVVAESSHMLWLSHFSNRPGKLFEGAQNRLTIMLYHPSIAEGRVFSTPYYRWDARGGERDSVFPTIEYTSLGSLSRKFHGLFPKTGTQEGVSIQQKLSNSRTVRHTITKASAHPVYWVRVPGYFCQFFLRPPKARPEKGGPERDRGELKTIFARDSRQQRALHAILNSSTYYQFYCIYTDGRHINPSDVYDFPLQMEKFDAQLLDELCSLSVKLEECAMTNTSQWRKSGLLIDSVDFKPCKPIIDEIDRALAQHYGFTAEELDFIINYDIKYRMGRDGGAGE